MIFEGEDVKIEEESDKLIHKKPEQCKQQHNREGNSHIYAKTGHWTDHQKLKYLLFLDHYESKLKIKEKRRVWKVFRAMAMFIKSRKPNQCRSHHQKMETYFESVSAIISYFKDKIPKYQQAYAQNLSQLNKVEFGFSCPDNQDYNQEESISNNDSAQKVDQLPFARKLGRSRTSIKLAEESSIIEAKDKNLPKTDHSLHDEEIKSERVIRPQSSYEFLNNPIYPYFPYHYSQSIPLITYPRPNLQNEMSGKMVNFFQFHRQKSSSQLQQNEWIECERLFLLWRKKYQSLIEKNH